MSENINNFYQTVPNSHYWTSIEMLVNFMNHYPNDNTPHAMETLKEVITVGLENTLKQGYQITKI